MSLLDNASGLMHRLSVECILGNSGLESAIEEFVESQTQHIIEFEFFGGEETISVHSSKEGSSFKQSPWVFLFKGEEFTSCLSEFGEGEMDSPNFSFILEPVLADELEFMIDPLLFVGTSGSLEGGGIYIREVVQLR